MNDTEALIVLNMINGIGPARISSLLSIAGAPADVFRLSESDLQRVPYLSAEQRQTIRHWETAVDLATEMRMIERSETTVLTQDSPEYPALLKTIADPPVVLYVRGKLPQNISERSIAIVGTRNITHYGADITRRLAEEAAFAGWNVVSGLAIGVDTIAHRATVNVRGRTVAVLGGGLSHLHPKENLQLARDIIDMNGAVVTEFPMQFTPTRHSFPMRNRIISGLTLGTIVTEAGINSGSLITASFALEQERRLFAVPQNVSNISPSGCNALIRKGAVLVENFEHVLDEFDFLPGFGKAGSLAETPSLFGDDMPIDDSALTDTEKVAFDALQHETLNLEQLSTKTGMPPQDLTSALIMLEIKSLITKNNDGTFRRNR